MLLSIHFLDPSFFHQLLAPIRCLCNKTMKKLPTYVLTKVFYSLFNPLQLVTPLHWHPWYLKLTRLHLFFDQSALMLVIQHLICYTLHSSASIPKYQAFLRSHYCHLNITYRYVCFFLLYSDWVLLSLQIFQYYFSLVKIYY